MYLKGIFLFVSLICFAAGAEASLTNQPIGARPVGLGLAFVGVADDANAIVYNPAGLALFPGTQVTSFFSRPFGLKELETAFAAASFSGKSWAFGAAVQQFGFSKYREQTTRVAFAHRFGKRFAFGGTLFYAHLQIAGYGNDGCLGLNLGYFFRLSPRWRIGGSILNASHAALRRGKEVLPQELNAGLQFLPLPNLRFAFQISQESNFPLSLRSGVEWTVLKQLVLRSGYLTEPARFTFGCGIYFGHFKVDYAWASHLLLGGTHQISAGIRF